MGAFRFFCTQSVFLRVHYSNTDDGAKYGAVHLGVTENGVVNGPSRSSYLSKLKSVESRLEVPHAPGNVFH